MHSFTVTIQEWIYFIVKGRFPYKIADILKKYNPCCVVGTDERTRAEKHTYFWKPDTTYLKISTIHEDNLKHSVEPWIPEEGSTWSTLLSFMNKHWLRITRNRYTSIILRLLGWSSLIKVLLKNCSFTTRCYEARRSLSWTQLTHPGINTFQLKHSF